MITLERTTSDHPDFIYLTDLFDTYLVEIDGDEKDFFAQYNRIYINNVLIAYDNGIAIGCGAFKSYQHNVAELKRMFVLPESRGKGVASAILIALENWAREEGYTSCILDTSSRLEHAIALYKKFDFQITPNYGQYIGVMSSVCMRKNI